MFWEEEHEHFRNINEKKRKFYFNYFILFYFLKSSLEFYFNCFSHMTFFNI